MTAEPWVDRVIEKLRALRAQAEADGQSFHDLCRYIDRWKPGTVEGLIRDDKEGVATKIYKDQPVFTFRMKEGQIVVHPTGGEPDSYPDQEQALDRMADLLARAINNPKWGEERTAA